MTTPLEDLQRFLRAAHAIVGETARGAPVMVVSPVIVTEPANYMIKITSRNMESRHVMAVIGYLVEGLAREEPDIKEVQRLAVAWRRITGSKGAFTDIPKDKN